ncbi:pyridoxal 5'-phosphate synthase glutaminase subunit PdxT [Adlercreutzia sp. R21]|uniref:pyridoxal 5'-phosphate synthase glutaminase subunit PdxT n=1 Tax=Adlercreutzia wanghongyangiae TaxID=3111451 RepID=UPI002DBC51E4|nr:pyridoxal 5'-phosphate synthase glutaminase subunit PdxT [Adlercreutzia sp. R21]MEC4185284.1 pyridoxal 5'-phosphate synthase glutaminase subunit PdxT [Adlercreutzia sp. R21]
MRPAIAVLALQGAFIEHEQRLQALGCDTVELRQAADLSHPFDGVVLPGGESTVQAKLLRDLGMFEPMRQRIAEGLPVLGTCAGLILLADHFRTLPVTVHRNAYGRQLGSFHAEGRWEGTGEAAETCRTADASGTPGTTRAGDDSGISPSAPLESVPLTFIRAPRIEAVGPSITPLVTLNGTPVAVRHRNQIAAAFHPELDSDNRLYETFLALTAAPG